MLYPLIFIPIPKERVWGGRHLERLYGKSLPPSTPVGESWEVSDRPEGLSVIANGPLRGKDLHWLMEGFATDLLGRTNLGASGRFPLLVKILDAREKLSAQVHPPKSKAIELGGEPKTEMWYVAHADPGAELLVGLRRGVTRAVFEQKTKDGTVGDCLHRVKVTAGDAMFLPSGRVHAIGAGLVIFEIQQNSDTTYRVFDWNRCGLDGKPRPLHVRESLESIDFNDFEPPLLPRTDRAPKHALVRDPLFNVDLYSLTEGEKIDLKFTTAQVIGAVSGRLEVHSPNGEQVDVSLTAGQFCLLPACLKSARLKALAKSSFLVASPGFSSEGV